MAKYKRKRAGRPRKSGERHSCGKLKTEILTLPTEMADRRKAAVIGILKAYERGDAEAYLRVRKEEEVSVSLEDILGLLHERFKRGREAIGITVEHHDTAVRYAKLRAMFGNGNAKIASYGDIRETLWENARDPIPLYQKIHAQLTLNQRRILDLIFVDRYLPEATEILLIESLKEALERIAHDLGTKRPL